MSVPLSADGTMRTIRFHAYGEPVDVLRLEEAAIPGPGPGRIRVRVHACGLNPADWALCRGLFPGDLPRGVGLDVSGVVDAVGEGVTDVSIGDSVLGPADYAGSASAGLADHAILSYWTRVPPGLDMVEAAALPMAVETAFRYLAWLGVGAEHTLLVNGGGTMIGFAAVQMAIMRGARVIATAGETFADQLRTLGAAVVGHGDGMVERVRELAGSPPDLVFDTAPTNLNPGVAPGVLRDLVEIVGGDPRRVITCADLAGATELGVRTGFAEEPTGEDGAVLRWDVLGDFARLAGEGRFTVPIARTFALEEWRDALDISLSGRAHGKLVILPAE
ncbi:MAG TPA: NADP-dependent oxidoreductase [Caulobacteraceae bacterium]|nr:NADP-dependent oxidoreductase [Caulobacteraceae bacterium]